jgi:hypothetical protein
VIKQTRRILAAILAGTLLPAYAAQLAPLGDAESAQRETLTREVIEKWSAHVAGSPTADVAAWRASMAAQMQQVPLSQLRKAAASRTFDGMNNFVTPAAVVPKALGDVASDLVFVPIAPCRIADTRLAGGVIGAGTTRAFDVTAVTDYTFQGGNASNCGGAGLAGSFAAVALNFTVVSNAAGHITAYPFLATRPVAATVNFNANDVRGNFAIVALDQGASASEMNVYSTSATHLIIDMVGYFTNPVATALSCVDTADTSTPVSAGATANSVAPACPAGYTQTATNCESSTWQMPFVYFSAGTCSAQNNSAGAATLRSSRTCCRVPGR